MCAVDSKLNAGRNACSACPVSAGSRLAEPRPQRLLIVMPKWVGDVVMATPALRAIRDRFSDSRITLLLKKPFAEILAGGDWMDDMTYWPTGRGRSITGRERGFLQLVTQIRQQRYDWAILLTNSARSALLASLAGIRKRIGYDRDGRTCLLTDRLLCARQNGRFTPGPMIDYYNAIAHYLGCRECKGQPELFTTPDDEAAVDALIDRTKIARDQPIIVLNPGAAFGPAKRWLPARFAAVGDALAAEHGAAVFVACGPSEIDTARDVAAHMNQPVMTLTDPVMPLGPLKALIRRASVMITNDTGPRHFANAFSTPVVTIFGPTHQIWSRTASPNERVIQATVDCGPCMQRSCPSDHRCMADIKADDVIALANELMNQKHPTAL